MKEWQQIWNNSEVSEWTHRIIPNVTKTISAHELDLNLGQALSGHDCFRYILHKFKRSPSPNCDCGKIEKPKHIFVKCHLHAADHPADPLDISNPIHLEYMRSMVHKLWEAEWLRQTSPPFQHNRL